MKEVGTMKLMPIRQLETLSSEEKIGYFRNLRDFCTGLSQKRNSKKNAIRNVLMEIYPAIRGYNYRIEGVENIPEDGHVLFLCNHSNSHDFFAVQEIFKNLGMRVSVLSGSDCLDFANRLIFKTCDAVLIDRNDKVSTQRGILELSSDIVNGVPGWIFGEGTWNLHPIRPMQPIKIGASLIAAISNVPIIPVIFEYVEVPTTCVKEQELYSECFVRFGKPINIDRRFSLLTQTNELLSSMIDVRLKTWSQLGIDRSSIKSIDYMTYLNHTYIKKFCAFGFTYDSEYESRFFYRAPGETFENEYHMDSQGNFTPGITSVEEGKKYIKKL